MSERDAPPHSAAERPTPVWTRNGWAYPALFLGSVIDSTVLPWPLEIPLLAVMLRGRKHVFPAALVVMAGSVLGCFLAFLVGARAYEAVAPWIADHTNWAARLEAARAKAEARGAAAVFIGMLSPWAQITSFAAGAAGVGTGTFLAASAIGRTIRYFAMAVPVFAFGPRIMSWWRTRSRRARMIGIALIAVAFVAWLLWGLMA
jgi:membrane protein YqaA with SNARE-associated domain